MSFARAWLAAYLLAASWPLGSLALILIHTLTGGRWGEALRPALRFGLCAMPAVLLGPLPLLPWLSDLYPWLHGDDFYRNGAFMAVRGVLYLVTWFGLAAAVAFGQAARVAAPGLFLLAVTFTFASVDATLTLDPQFVSSIYGMIAGSGAVMLALAVAVLIAAPDLPPAVRQDAGKLLLSVVILWTYLDFMQVLIVWQSDLAHDARWYLQRSTGIWGGVGVAVVLIQSALPIALLIAPGVRRSVTGLRLVGGLLIVSAVLRAWWTAVPPLPPGVWDLVCVLALGAATALCAGWIARRSMRTLRHV